MSEDGLRQAREKMRSAGVDPAAIEVFTHYYRLLETGATGLIREDSIEPAAGPAGTGRRAGRPGSRARGPRRAR